MAADMARLKVLMSHTYYQIRGGEDGSYEAERDLLRRRGHDVIEFVRHNEQLAAAGILRQAAKTVWNSEAADDFTAVITRENPDVIHFQNTFPGMSPTVLRAAKKTGKPVVMGIHNFRTTCVNALMYRNGGPCEDCLGSVFPWRGIVHSCYRSRSASSVVAVMNAVHHLGGTWDAVDRFIVLSEFQRDRLSDVLPPHKLMIRPNFVYPDPGQGDGGGKYALFVGRISEEKGLGPLVEAWVTRGTTLPLKVVGDGPTLPALRQKWGKSEIVEFTGRMTSELVLGVLGEAAALVLPSLWYEGFPRVIVEAFSRGTPVVTYDIGTQGDVVEDGVTGLVCSFGQPEQLVEASARIAGDEALRQRLGAEARSRFEDQHTEDESYRRLMEIYAAAGA